MKVIEISVLLTTRALTPAEHCIFVVTPTPGRAIKILAWYTFCSVRVIFLNICNFYLSCRFSSVWTQLQQYSTTSAASRTVIPKNYNIVLTASVVWCCLAISWPHALFNDVAMGSPLGPAFANIFVGHQEQTLQRCQWTVSVLPVRWWHVRRVQQWRWLQCVSFPPQLPSPLLTLHPWTGIQSLPPLLRCVGWKMWLRIFNISLQETYLHWPVSTLEFLQPPQTENQFNRYFRTQGFHDLFKRRTWPRTWQNPFNPIGKWLSGKFNQVHYQTKASTT